MMSLTTEGNRVPEPRNAIAALRRFARPRPPGERCELCAAPLGEEHQHLIEPSRRQLFCACDPCAILFSGKEAARFRRIPRRVELWPDFSITDARWDDLGIPIGLAFFFQSSIAGQAACIYPSPAGGTEATIPAEPWQMLCEENPLLATLEPEVEALLVNRVLDTHEYYRAPIDQCFKLVGLIRTHWRGLSGGAQAWGQIAQFFRDLRSRAAEVSALHA